MDVDDVGLRIENDNPRRFPAAWCASPPAPAYASSDIRAGRNVAGHAASTRPCRAPPRLRKPVEFGDRRRGRWSPRPGPPMTARQHFDAGQQFGKRIGFWQIIVAAGAQALDCGRRPWPSAREISTGVRFALGRADVPMTEKGHRAWAASVEPPAHRSRRRRPSTGLPRRPLARSAT